MLYLRHMSPVAKRRVHAWHKCLFASSLQRKRAVDLFSIVSTVQTCLRSCLLFVGSERNKLSGATGDHFREACSINKSLTCLGRVIMELVEAQRQGRRRTHIPYRDSRLTFLLQVRPLCWCSCDFNFHFKLLWLAAHLRLTCLHVYMPDMR